MFSLCSFMVLGGTSGGVSAVHNQAGFHRLHQHGRTHGGTPGEASGGDGMSGTGSGGNGSGNGSGKYKGPLLTEELLLVHNRGMEQKMIKHYKDAKKSELVFVKNPKPKAEAANKVHLKTRTGAAVGYPLGNWTRVSDGI